MSALRRGKRKGRAPAVPRQGAGEAAAERDAGEKGGQHGGEGVDAAAHHVGEHARPEHFVEKALAPETRISARIQPRWVTKIPR